MNCEGLVTKVDPFYGYFEVDDKYRVYMCLLRSNNIQIKLPEKFFNTVSKNLHKSLNTFIACPSSKIIGRLNVNITLNSFTNLIKTYKLGAADILMIDQTLRTFETNFNFENEITGKVIFSALLETVIKLHLPKGELHSEFCLNKCLLGISITSINSCKNVEIKTRKFYEFPPWSFGVHSKPKNYTYLFGFLYVDPQYGFLMIKDHFHKMVCIIENNFNSDHCYVLIRNYKIITEIYKEHKIPNLEYLITNSEDVIILQSDKEHTGSFGNILLDGFEYTMEFILLRKSTICVGQDKETKTYLQIKSINKNEIEDTYFLTLPSKYTTIVLHLKEGFKYKMHHNKPLKEEVNAELSSIEKLKNFTIIEMDAYFEELEIAKNVSLPPVLRIEDCKQYISENSNMFSFEGVIERRGFVKSLSLKHIRTSLYGFSTPGRDTHTLTFGYQENGSDFKITVYLSEWINRLMPLGLIPQMRVRLKHVQPKSTYIKSTIFTTIEILSYEPLVDFCTANLFENYDINWGPQYYLSKGHDIPQGVIVWSKIYNIRIFEVKMSHTCPNCNVIIEASGSCNDCDCQETLFTFFLVMHVYDTFGISKVIVKDVRFLRVVLNLTEAQFPVWLDAFRDVGEFSFNIHEVESQYDPMFKANKFKNMLSLYFLTFNNLSLDEVELKCRKLALKVNKKKTKEPHPNWFYLDARRNLQI